jgi:hypothetical protein
MHVVDRQWDCDRAVPGRLSNAKLDNVTAYAFRDPVTQQDFYKSLDNNYQRSHHQSPLPLHLLQRDAFQLDFDHVCCSVLWFWAEVYTTISRRAVLFRFPSRARLP